MATIAIVGMACRFPDAPSPAALWENVLAQRQAFRRLPRERLCLDDYWSADRSTPDCTYAAEAALLEGYEFDRVRFRVAGSTFRAADLVHWLALDVAADALADAGFPDGHGLPRATTGVLLGNTLTGELSRANVMRLRWPYVRRVVEAALVGHGWAPERRRAFLADLETTYKAPFPPIGEESLAGGLSNTIAGRICNHFDLHGGGYIVDGACAASLLALANACSALSAGDLDVALAGGVDVSLDPFELVGFAKAGALAAERMRVYDARAAGFWPGEGCGVVVLMRYDDAVIQQRRIYAVIRGWGISSDGHGGLTRPEVEGQLLAVRRAYQRAGFGIQTVTYFEGHGTGTEVGDATELRVLSRARREAAPQEPPAVIGTVKANIGHTKAASGIAGLIKTCMALQAQILPPTTGCERPHPELTGEAPALRVLPQGEPWPADRPLRAGVSAMGFGGINTHVVLEGVATPHRQTLTAAERALLAAAQDAELFLLGARDHVELRRQVEHLAALAPRLSRAELADLAARLCQSLAERQVRAAIVASSPAELAGRLELLRSWLMEGITARLDGRAGVFLGEGDTVPRLGFLFPGQGVGVARDGGALARRFPALRQLFAQVRRATDAADPAAAVPQPAIVAASLAGLRALRSLGIEAHLAIGHSLGELTALHWGGAFGAAALLRVATARGQAMAAVGRSSGAMASIGAARPDVEELVNRTPVVIACLNAPQETVVSGEAAAVAAVVAQARARGLRAVPLAVPHAFHSPLVAAAVPALAQHLAREEMRPLRRTVVSTVTGAPLDPQEDLRHLLMQQVTSPVQFLAAVNAVSDQVDLWLEVGPGQVLSRLVGECAPVSAVALEVSGPSLSGLWQAVGAAFALGAPVHREALSAGRFTRPFNLNWQPRFLGNPCELAPRSEPEAGRNGVAKCPAPPAERVPAMNPVAVEKTPGQTPLEVVRQLVSHRAELPPRAIRDDARLLGDLHLNSIAVGQLVAEAARHLGLPPPAAPTDYAHATVAEVAVALEERVRTGGPAPRAGGELAPAGVDSWIRAFTIAWVERPLPRRPVPAGASAWQIIASADDPLRGPLQQALARPGSGRGVVVCLPPEPDERHVRLLLAGAQAVFAERPPVRLVLVQHGGGGAAFARTLHLEAPEVITCVVDVPAGHPQAVEWIRAEAVMAAGYTEAQYDAVGTRREPVLRLSALAPDELGKRGRLPHEATLGPEDVLLVTGGGKGIAAECALFLARTTGARLALLARSQPATDAELAANLERMAAAGIRFRYLTADVTDAAAVQTAVRQAETDLGPITGILHGAGTNVPRLLRCLDEPTFLSTLAPKLQGARHVLAAVDPARLRLLVTFGSLIARTGMRGEADYAVANDWLTRLTERWQAEHPHCRCLAIEWSVWSGVGMGERLGRVEALRDQGITPIPPDEGVRLLGRLLDHPFPAVPVVVTGRFGDPPTLRLDRPELPLLRFLERPRVYYPGVELVADAELSADTDPYVNDHVWQGVRLFPAVVGLEAMAQAAMALAGTTEPPVFEGVKFTRPIGVPADGSVTVRVAALARGPGRIEVVLRSEETAFAVNHFEATCRFGGDAAGKKGRSVSSQEPEAGATDLLIHPDRDLYDGLLFHRGRFRCLRGYQQLRATECRAEIAPGEPANWFGRYLPGRLVLGDPAVRDAAVHAIQACIPQATVLPVGVERVLAEATPAPGLRFVRARERVRQGDLFTYDLEVTGAEGIVRERWEGLQLRIAQQNRQRHSWPAPLLGPYIERRVQELIPGLALAVVVEQSTAVERDARRQQALRRLLGASQPVGKRPDGKPEVSGEGGVTVAHVGNLTLAVAGPPPLGCDAERVVCRPADVWRDLLGPERWALAGVVAREAAEEEAVAATRVWAVGECLTKAGAPANTPVVLTAATADGWVLFAAGRLRLATVVAAVRDVPDRLVLAVLGRGGYEGL